MNNRFEFNKEADDVGFTVVENAFINHFMPKARGDYVKVYLYGLKNCLYLKNIVISDEDMAEALDIKPDDVVNSWLYWEKEGAVDIDETEEGYTIRFRSITSELFFGSLQAIKPQNVKRSRTPKVKKMFERTEAVLSRPLTVSEADMFYLWLDEFKFTPEAVSAIIEDCVSRGKTNLQYWNGMAVNLYDEGIRTLSDVRDYLQKRDETNKRYKEVLNYLGKYEAPSQPQKKMMDKWFDEYGFDMDKVKAACDETLKACNPSFKYVDSVLSAWKEGREYAIEAPSAKASSKKNVRLENDHNYDPEEIEKAIFGRDIIGEMES